MDRSHLAPRDEMSERLVRTREAFGKSQTDFARGAGIGLKAYSNYENGYRVGLDAAIKLCQAYSLSLDWIYFGTYAGLPASVQERIRNYRPGSQPVDGRINTVRQFRRRTSDGN